jgi:phosphohistidine phosphatase
VKHLILVRHAKSSWKELTASDFDRPLNRRGERDAPRMGEHLASRIPRPDALVSSSAVRALETARAFARAFGLRPEEVRAERELYLASAETWLGAIARLDEAWERVAMFGHNPGISDLVRALTNALVEDLPTCAIAELELEVDHWGEVGPGSGRLVRTDRPKDQPE